MSATENFIRSTYAPITRAGINNTKCHLEHSKKHLGIDPTSDSKGIFKNNLDKSPIKTEPP